MPRLPVTGVSELVLEVQDLDRSEADFDAVVERLRAAGEPMPVHAFGTTHGRAAYLTDPDGHVVELWTWDIAGHLATIDDA